MAIAVTNTTTIVAKTTCSLRMVYLILKTPLEKGLRYFTNLIRYNTLPAVSRYETWFTSVAVFLLRMRSGIKVER
jgi:hypothetical protein